MITLRKETKRGSEFINAHKMSKFSDIYEAYGRPSSAKCSAFRRCVEMCNKENGRCLRITGAGSFFFSVAWLTDDGLRVETAYNSYLIK